MKKLTAAGITAALALAGCGSSHPAYPANVQSNFLNACEANATTAQCGCSLRRIEAHVSISTFQVGEDEYVTSGQYPSWLMSAATRCASS